MADAMEIIISAVDSASEVFQSIIESATGMSDGIGGAVEEASANFDMITDNVAGFTDAVQSIDNSTLEELGEELGMSADEVQRLLEVGSGMGALSAGFNEASIAADELEKEIQKDVDAMDELGSAGDVMAAQSLMNMVSGLKDSMLGMADSAGTFNDSMMRASLEAEGAGLSVGEMKDVVSELSETTGRAGGQIRESFIKATARGVTDMDSFKQMMEGAGAQATLFGTDIQTMGDKFSSMAQKNTLMERSLAETGITMDELADAMGMSGATADEVKDKWKELDTNQRAAILGQAASMNEGKNANDAYKNSWAGLQEQMNIAKGRLERIVGSVILPVLIPAMKLAGTVLNGVGDAVNGIMSGPLGGLVSILGTLAGVFVIGVSGALALKNMMGFLKLETELAAVAQTAETFATIAQSEAGYAGAVANLFQTSSFGVLANSAWAAARAIWAAVAPLLPFIAAAALVVVAVYEVGKAFGWWTDVSSMIDAIQAGIMRLWNAFINHPDVQAVITALTNAWNEFMKILGGVKDAILDFFGITTGGDFDIVAALIHGIGDAWNAIREPIIAVIDIIMSVIDVFNQLATGQMDLETAVLTVWQSLQTNIPVILQFISTYLLSFVGQMAVYAVNAGLNFLNGIGAYISQVPGRVWNYLVMTYNRIVTQLTLWVNRARAMALQFVMGIITRIATLPARIRSYLVHVVSVIVSAIQSWITHAVAKVNSFVSQVTGPFKDIPDKIESALSSVVEVVTAPFRNAYDTVKPWLDKIASGIDILKQLPMGGDTAMGGDIATDSITGKIFNTDNGEWIVSDENINVEITEKIILDLINVPAHIDTQTLIKMLQDKEVLRALTGNKDFQDLDRKVKDAILLKLKRSKGV